MKKEKKEQKTIYVLHTSFPRQKREPLSYEELNEFRELIGRPVFWKALTNAYALKPSACSGPSADPHPSVSSERVSHDRSMRLAQIQGWEMFEAALLSQAETRQTKNTKEIPTESFTSE